MTRGICCTVLAILLRASPSLADNPLEAKFGKPPPDPKQAKTAATTTTAAPPLDIDAAAHKALAHLGHAQHSSGGWGQFTVRPPSLTKGLARPDIKDGVASTRGDVVYPPNLAETAAVTAAFLEAGVSPVRGDAAKPMRAALDALHDLVTRPSPDSTPAAADTTVGMPQGCCQVTRVMLNPSLDSALALDALLACRAHIGEEIDKATRTRIDQDAVILLARLKVHQRGDGAWEVNRQVESIIGYYEKKKADAAAQGKPAHWWYEKLPRTAPVLADAFITRTLFNAARAGLPVDADVFAAAISHLRTYHDPDTGELGGAGTPDDQREGDAFYRSVAALNALYHLARTADAPTDREARQRTLTRAHGAFFKKLRAASDKNAATPGKNPLEKPAAATQPIRIDVPISSVDALAYFLLLESLQGSTHPDARPVALAITDTLARRQAGGGWSDPNRGHTLDFHWAILGGLDSDGRLPRPVPTNHLLTALATRALLLPLPPEPPK